MGGTLACLASRRIDVAVSRGEPTRAPPIEHVQRSSAADAPFGSGFDAQASLLS
jgi:hypothetical protein